MVAQGVLRLRSVALGARQHHHTNGRPAAHQRPALAGGRPGSLHSACAPARPARRARSPIRAGRSRLPAPGARPPTTSAAVRVCLALADRQLTTSAAVRAWRRPLPAARLKARDDFRERRGVARRRRVAATCRPTTTMGRPATVAAVSRRDKRSRQGGRSAAKGPCAGSARPFDRPPAGSLAALALARGSPGRSTRPRTDGYCGSQRRHRRQRPGVRRSVQRSPWRATGRRRTAGRHSIRPCRRRGCRDRGCRPHRLAPCCGGRQRRGNQARSVAPRMRHGSARRSGCRR